MKKLLSLLLVLTMVFAFMAMSGTAFAADDTLTVYAWDANFNIPALKAAEAAYQKVNPNFKLEIATQSGSSDVEQAMTLAGSSGDLSSLPDIVLFQDHFIQSYVADYPDCWVDLQLADIDWSDFGAEKLSYSTIDGVHYGVPVDNGTAIFAYRTDVLEEAGYTIDDVTGISWDEWLEIAKEVKEKTGFALLSMDHSGDDLPYMMMQAEGLSQWRSGKPNLVGNEPFERIIEVIVQGAKDGTILLANSWSEYCDQTIVGNQTAGLDGGKDGYAANGGSSLYITGNCKNVELACDFLAYTFGGGEGAMETYDNALRDGGVITCCISAGESEVYQEGVDYFGGQAIYSDIVDMGAFVPVVEQNDYHYTARTYVGNAITNIINGGDLESELQDAQDQIEFEMG